MEDTDQSIREVYDAAEQRRHTIEHSISTAAANLQESIQATIQLYERCLQIADQISLFSPNETLEDISSADLKYLLLNYRLGELRMRASSSDRKSTILSSRTSYERYIKQLDTYDILSKADSQLLEAYTESPNTFSTAASKDAATRREQKIRRFKEEKGLREKLAHLEQDPVALENDDQAYRELQMTQIAYCTHQAFQNLESIAQELHILSLAPPAQHHDLTGRGGDSRQRNGTTKDGYSERLDTAPLSAGLKGPLLDSKGKPLRPFTLFGSKREEIRAGVFRPDHSLPTMTIDEYLEEERKRGGIIDGGGPQSGIKPEVDEDDIEAADRATMKARDWDEYVEANPKGSGNTINRG